MPFKKREPELSNPSIGGVCHSKGVKHDLKVRVNLFLPAVVTVKAVAPEGTASNAVVIEEGLVGVGIVVRPKRMSRIELSIAKREK